MDYEIIRNSQFTFIVKKTRIIFSICRFILLILCLQLCISCQSPAFSTTPLPLTQPPSPLYSEEVIEVPLARALHVMSYDRNRQVVVLFGGINETGNKLNDTWEYDGNSWKRIETPTAPPRRIGHAMVYDTDRNVTILFGGTTDDDEYTNDMWEYDGKNWKQIDALSKPSARYNAAMIYDPEKQSMILFGGDGYGGQLWDTWEFNEGEWKEINIPPPLSGAGATYPQMVYDAQRAVTVLQTTFSETFEYDGESWQNIFQFGNPQGVQGIIIVPRLAYNTIQGKTILFGGEQIDNRNDTWVYENSIWSKVTPEKSPPARTSHAMVYDESRDVVVLFGGSNLEIKGDLLNDTWEFDGAIWIQR